MPPVTLFSDHIRRITRRLAVFVLVCAGIATILGSGSGNDSGNPTFDSAITLSGFLDEGGAPSQGTTVRALVVPTPASDTEESSTTSDSSGNYTARIRRNVSTYLEFSKTGFATINSRFGSFDQNVSGLDFGMITANDAEAAIDAAFGGMAFNLADKAWLAVNVEDSSGNEIDGVRVTTVPAIAGGGALNCDGSLTGGDITTALPPCNPSRSGPMYLAYYDADAEVIVTGAGLPDTATAPVRVGEVTVVSLVWSSTSTTTGTLQVEAEEGGTVTLSPIVLQCIGPNFCETQVDLGAVVTLTATPAPGWHFDDWDGCDIEVMSDRTGGICERTISDFNFIRAEFDPGAP